MPRTTPLQRGPEPNTGGDAGIDILGGSAGTFTFGNATITNPTGTGLNIDSSSAAVTYSGGSGISQNNFARVVVCGLISGYNALERAPGPSAFPMVLIRR